MHAKLGCDKHEAAMAPHLAAVLCLLLRTLVPAAHRPSLPFLLELVRFGGCTVLQSQVT
jgi:hypothetical protein